MDCPAGSCYQVLPVKKSKVGSIWRALIAGWRCQNSGVIPGCAKRSDGTKVPPPGYARKNGSLEKKSGGSHGSDNALPEMRKTHGAGCHPVRPHRPAMHKL